MVFQNSLLLLNGGNAGVHDVEEGQHHDEGYDRQDNA